MQPSKTPQGDQRPESRLGELPDGTTSSKRSKDGGGFICTQLPLSNRGPGCSVSVFGIAIWQSQFVAIT